MLAPPATAALESVAPEPPPIREQVVEQRGRERGSSPRSRQNGSAEPRRGELTRRLSFTVAYDLWLDTWRTTLSALATASQSRALSTTEVAAHKAVIAAERELVTKQFALLLGHELPRGVVSITTAEGRFMLDQQAPPTRNAEVHRP